MPYRQYVVYMRPSATCGACGRQVRLRHFRSVILGVVVAFAMIPVLSLIGLPVIFLVAYTVLIALLALLFDFWTYRNLPWDPVDPADGDR